MNSNYKVNPSNLLHSLVISLRPYQWIKNLLVFSGLIFSRSLFDREAIELSFTAFVLFCMASSSIYLLNDLKDLEQDRIHPEKRLRPLAAGKIRPGIAILMMIILLSCSEILAWSLQPKFAFVMNIYLFMNFAYSFGLKKIVIVDVIIVAMGFLLRAIAGAVVIGVQPSHWLILCTLMLALLLSLGKRRSELTLLNDSAHNHRQSLGKYSIQYLDMIMSLAGSASIITYALYTMSEETIHRVGSSILIYTTPLVIYGVFRYFYLVYNGNKSADPTRLLITDIPLILSIILWIVLVCIFIYFHPGLAI